MESLHMSSIERSHQRRTSNVSMFQMGEHLPVVQLGHFPTNAFDKTTFSSNRTHETGTKLVRNWHETLASARLRVRESKDYRPQIFCKRRHSTCSDGLSFFVPSFTCQFVALCGLDHSDRVIYQSGKMNWAYQSQCIQCERRSSSIWLLNAFGFSSSMHSSIVPI